MATIVRRFPVSVEDLAQLNLLPLVSELRPAFCPLCGEPAHCSGKALGIVGHGTYRRQVAGVFEGCRDLVIRVRRFLCRGCRRTISILPESLYPGRWYSAITIVLSLAQSLLQGIPAHEIRLEHTGDESGGGGWKTLRRWRRQLLGPLFGWLRPQLGVGADSAVDRREGRRRLQRLLGIFGATDASPPSTLADAARKMLEGTAHLAAKGWSMKRGSPSETTPAKDFRASD